MSKTFSVFSLLLAAFSITSSYAAESTDQTTPGTTAENMVNTTGWVGSYVGLTAGTYSSRNDWTTSQIAPTIPGITPGSNSDNAFNVSANRMGALLGRNWSLGASSLFGVEVDFDSGARSATRMVPATDITQGTYFPNGPTGSVTSKKDASLRVRLGWMAGPDTLLYSTAGFAWQEVTVAASCSVSAFCVIAHNESVTKVATGWTAGLGLEHRLQKSWHVRAEYRYSDFGSLQHTFFTDGLIPGGQDDRFTADVRMRSSSFNVGLVYMF